MKWITRERPKIDRIACPWLIKNFVDKEAEFIYVPPDIVQQKAKELNAIPFDIPGVEFSHYEDKCTFDYVIKKYKITDRAVHTLAIIVRGADYRPAQHSKPGIRFVGYISGFSLQYKRRSGIA